MSLVSTADIPVLWQPVQNGREPIARFGDGARNFKRERVKPFDIQQRWRLCERFLYSSAPVPHICNISRQKTMLLS